VAVAVLLLPVLRRASERTTSPLQIGQVRRRVVSQGVLGYGSQYYILVPRVTGGSTYMHSA